VWLGISRDDETAIVAIVDEHLESKLAGLTFSKHSV
jgi:hypothetical protein